MHSGKPLVSNNCIGGQSNILSENGIIANDQVSMCKMFNGLLNVVADNIGQDPNEIMNYTNEDDLDGLGI